MYLTSTDTGDLILGNDRAQAGKGTLHWAAQYALPGEALTRLARESGAGAVRAADARGNTPLILAALGDLPAHLCARPAVNACFTVACTLTVMLQRLHRPGRSMVTHFLIITHLSRTP